MLPPPPSHYGCLILLLPPFSPSCSAPHAHNAHGRTVSAWTVLRWLLPSAGTSHPLVPHGRSARTGDFISSRHWFPLLLFLISPSFQCLSELHSSEPLLQSLSGSIPNALQNSPLPLYGFCPYMYWLHQQQRWSSTSFLLIIEDHESLDSIGFMLPDACRVGELAFYSYFNVLFSKTRFPLSQAERIGGKRYSFGHFLGRRRFSWLNDARVWLIDMLVGESRQTHGLFVFWSN